MAKDWIQSVDKEMKKKGTVGAFTKEAKEAGMTVHDFAKKVVDNPEEFSEKTRRRAQFALNMEKIAKNRKYMKGGKTQGYNDKLDEDLGSRLGRETKYKQSLKDRRDESKAGNKTVGRRAYASVETMDKGDRMMMHGGKTEIMHGGKMKMMKGGKMKQGYAARQNESLGMRTGKESTKKQSMKARRDDSYGKFGKRDMEDRKITMARGGAVKGKIDRDRYVKLRREKDKEIAKLKKEKGALRKEVQELGKKPTTATPKTMVSKDENQTILMGGIAGILFGAFLLK